MSKRKDNNNKDQKEELTRNLILKVITLVKD